jgi:hypothetical protein
LLVLAAIDDTHPAAPYALFYAITAYDGFVCQESTEPFKAKVIQRRKKVKGKRQKLRDRRGGFSSLTFALWLFTFGLFQAVFFSSS